MLSIFKKVKGQGRTILTEIESKEVLKAAGIPVVETILATSKEASQIIASNIGFPVALKVCSPQILHKTDVGGVFLNLANEEEVGAAYEQIIKSAAVKYPHLNIREVSVQKMVNEGIEVVIGMNRDSQFGPVIMFGLGGIFVEILKDVSFRIVPLTEEDIWEMLSEIKGCALLEGARGAMPVQKKALVDVILKISRFVEESTELSELDINPLFASSKGVLAADARMIIS